MTGEALLNERARVLLEDVERRTLVTEAELERTAGELFCGAIPYSEQMEVVQKAMEMAAEQNRKGKPEEGPLQLSPPQTRELALEFFKANPGATSREAWKAVSKVGEPSCKYASFAAATCPAVRKQLGIKWRAHQPKKRVIAPAEVETTRGSEEAALAAVPAPAPSLPSPPAPTVDPSRRIEIDWDGATLKATGDPEDRWKVDFQGTLTSRQLDRMIPLLLETMRNGAEEARA